MGGNTVMSGNAVMSGNTVIGGNAAAGRSIALLLDRAGLKRRNGNYFEDLCYVEL